LYSIADGKRIGTSKYGGGWEAIYDELLGDRTIMIGMTFSSFLALLVIGAACALSLRGILKPRPLGLGNGYIGQLIVGWLGAWIGSAVVGHWGWIIPATNVYMVPTVISSLAAIYALIESVKIIESLLTPLSLREILAPANEKNKVA
jgi:hypothetical protein